MRDRLPISALLAAAIVLAVELIGVPLARHFALESLWLHSSPGADDPLRVAAQVELADASKRLIYVTGSSQARDNVDREQVQTLLANAGVTDAELWNLGINGGDTIDAFLQLDAMTKKPPRLVVLIVSWVFFYDDYDPTKLELYCTSIARLRQLAQLYTPQSFWHDADGELSSAVLANLVPSFRWARSYLSLDLLGALAAERTEPLWFKRGSPHDEAYFRRTIARHGTERHRVSVDTLRKRRALAAFARELRELGSDLVVVEAPLHPRRAEMAGAFYVIWDDYLTNMRAMSEQLGFPYVELGACDVDDAALFNDFGHLNDRGRAKFTECITRELVLPSLGEGDADDAGEDHSGAGEPP